MRRSITAAPLLLLAAGCPEPLPGSLVSETLPVGVYQEAYAAALEVADYEGPAAWALTLGTLPQGLTFSEAGEFAGTPGEVGSFPLQVRVSGMDGVADFTASLDLRVELAGEDAAVAFLGWEHTQLNNFAEDDMMLNVWVRAEGTGLPDMSSYTIDLGVYLPGPNGEAEDGLGDDQRVGTLGPDDVTWEFGTWNPRDGVSEFDPSLPPHTPEGSEPTFENLTLSAGGDTGSRWATASSDLYQSLDVRLDVTAPDWCSTGIHRGGWAPGCCLIEDCPDDMRN